MLDRCGHLFEIDEQDICDQLDGSSMDAASSKRVLEARPGEAERR